MSLAFRKSSSKIPILAGALRLPKLSIKAVNRTVRRYGVGPMSQSVALVTGDLLFKKKKKKSQVDSSLTLLHVN